MDWWNSFRPVGRIPAGPPPGCLVRCGRRRCLLTHHELVGPLFDCCDKSNGEARQILMSQPNPDLRRRQHHPSQLGRLETFLCQNPRPLTLGRLPKARNSLAKVERGQIADLENRSEILKAAFESRLQAPTTGATGTASPVPYVRCPIFGAPSSVSRLVSPVSCLPCADSGRRMRMAGVG